VAYLTAMADVATPPLKSSDKNITGVIDKFIVKNRIIFIEQTSVKHDIS